MSQGMVPAALGADAFQGSCVCCGGGWWDREENKDKNSFSKLRLGALLTASSAWSHLQAFPCVLRPPLSDPDGSHIDPRVYWVSTMCTWCAKHCSKGYPGWEPSKSFQFNVRKP